MTRVAFVSGGSRGIGRAVCLALADAGCDVAVGYRRDRDAADDTADEVRRRGSRALVVAGSVDHWSECERMVSEVVDVLGPMSVLVHSAGIASRGLPVQDTDPDELERVVRIHAFGAFYLAKLCLPHMLAADRSDIVVVSSVATDHMVAGGAPYNMGKAALEALAATLSDEVGGTSVHVNVVAPGLVSTEMGDRLVRAMTKGSVRDATELDDSAAFGRVCRPEDVANVIAFLVSDAAEYVSGARIKVDGGYLPFERAEVPAGRANQSDSGE